MSTILRSVKFVRKLNVRSTDTGRLRYAGLHRTSRSKMLSQRSGSFLRISAILPATSKQNYVTKAAVEESFNNNDTVDLLLNQIDKKIRAHGNIFKNDVEEVLAAITRTDSITPSQALLVIRSCGEFLSSESLESRRSLFDSVQKILKDLKVTIDVSHYNAILLVNLENEKDFSPADFLLDMKNNNITPNRVTFQRLIEHFCCKGDIEGATKILEHLSQQNLPINETIFNSLIKGHSEAGDITSAVKILDVMKQAEIEPTSRTYTEIICAYVKAGDIDNMKITLQQCIEKDIQLHDKDILDIIYALAIYNHPELIPELMTRLVKGQTYNRLAAGYISKLIDKNCIDAAFTLSKSFINLTPHLGKSYSNFFLRKLVLRDSSAETIIKYCKIMDNENIHKSTFASTLYTAYVNNKHHLALPLLMAWKESGEELREHYFYPIFASFAKDNDLKGILNTMQTMISDLNCCPSIHCVRDYIIPYIGEKNISNLYMLFNHKLPYSIGINALLNYLLKKKQTHQAFKFMQNVPKTFNATTLAGNILYITNSKMDYQVDILVSIIHLQYARMLNQENSSIKTENPSAINFSSNLLVKIINLPEINMEKITDILTYYLQKGISIHKDAVTSIQNYHKDKLPADALDILSKLESGNLTPEPIINYRTNNQNNINDRNEMVLEHKMHLLQQYCRLHDQEGVKNLLKELQDTHLTNNAGFCATLVDYFSKYDNIEEADKWYECFMKIDSENLKMDKAKIINYVNLLIKKQRASDAMKVLKVTPVKDYDSNRDRLCKRLIINAYTYIPEHIEELLQTLHAKGFVAEMKKANMGLIINRALIADDLNTAMDKFEWSCKTLKSTPMRSKLMKYLIKKEDAKSLQHVTNLVTDIYGESNALIDLSFAFLECKKMRQAKQILEMPGIGMRNVNSKIAQLAERYWDAGKIDMLKDLKDFINDLNIDKEVVYLKLLESHEKNNEWQKALYLWTEMQENNIQPSEQFMFILENILKKNNQEVPFAKTNFKFSSNVTFDKYNEAFRNKNIIEAEAYLEMMDKFDRNKHYNILILYLLDQNEPTKATECTINFINNLDYLSFTFISTIKEVIAKLVEINDFENIIKLVSVLKKKTIPASLSLSYVISQNYFECGKFNELLTGIQRHLNNSKIDKTILDNLFHNSVAVNAIQNDSQLEETLKELAYKAVPYKFYGPINTIWIHLFLKNSSEAENIWKQYLNNYTSFQFITTLYICRDQQAWEKLPALTEKLRDTIMTTDDRVQNITFMLNLLLKSDIPRRYEIAYNCLSNISTSLDLKLLNQGILSNINGNLTDGRTIEALQQDREEEQKEATG